MYKDYEYLLVDTEGTEDIIFSAKTLKSVAKFCKKNYSEIRAAHSKQYVFKFENRKVKIVSIDMNANYGV